MNIEYLVTGIVTKMSVSHLRNNFRPPTIISSSNTVVV